MFLFIELNILYIKKLTYNYGLQFINVFLLLLCFPLRTRFPMSHPGHVINNGTDSHPAENPQESCDLNVSFYHWMFFVFHTILSELCRLLRMRILGNIHTSLSGTYNHAKVKDHFFLPFWCLMLNHCISSISRFVRCLYMCEYLLCLQFIGLLLYSLLAMREVRYCLIILQW